MKILVDKVYSDSAQPIGFAKLPSFQVHFQSDLFSGLARFVPASGECGGCEGGEFEVELDQDSVTDFRLREGADLSIEALAEPGAFGVIARVRDIVQSNDEAVGQYFHVANGDVVFTLSEDDIGASIPPVGALVSFTVKGLSLWDEAI